MAAKAYTNGVDTITHVNFWGAIGRSFLFKASSIHTMWELICNIDSFGPHPDLENQRLNLNETSKYLCTNEGLKTVHSESFQGNFLKPRDPVCPKSTWPPDLSLFLQLFIMGQYSCAPSPSWSAKELPLILQDGKSYLRVTAVLC